MAMKTYTIEEIEDKYIGKKGSKTHAKYACLLYFQANYLEFPKKSHTFALANKPRWRNR